LYDKKKKTPSLQEKKMPEKKKETRREDEFSVQDELFDIAFNWIFCVVFFHPFSSFLKKRLTCLIFYSDKNKKTKRTKWKEGKKNVRRERIRT
jgi:hypothetical protein